MNTGKSHNERLLVVSTNNWPSAGQVASALGLAGFQVAVVCPIDSPTYRLRKVHARFPYRSRTAMTSVESAIATWTPTFIVCADDDAVRGLLALHSKASETMDEPSSKRLLHLIELSLGSCRGIATAMSKSAVLALAKSLGIACPQTMILTDKFALAREHSGIAFPLIVKTDDASGGLGTRLANNRLELRVAIAELSLPYNWPFYLKRFFGRTLSSAFFHWPPRRRPRISIQQFVVGRPCNRAVICWNGKVLAGITIDVLATSHEFGPARFVKVIDHPDVTAAAKKIVAKLGLSGFLGLDFMLDHKGNAWFLEVNPRATPICHVCANDQDLAGSLFVQMTGMRPKAVYCVIHQQAFTLFPGEPLRSQRNVDQEIDAFDDAPVDEPEFVEACRAQENIRQRLWRLSCRRSVCR